MRLLQSNKLGGIRVLGEIDDAEAEASDLKQNKGRRTQ